MSTPERMSWDRLLSSARLRGGAATPSSEPRNEFERDYDRILFSEPFRRLMDKTQVFPMPENDHVHNRLIHSLEVASVGRSMGRLVGREMTPDRSGDIGDVVASACLMHDLGNPPFGHAGEDAIASWFAAHAELLAPLDPEQRADLARFEGNAQSFRTVARLSMYGEDGGMRLTHAVLAAAAKYPCAATSNVHGKFNYFVNDAELFAEVAAGVGLLPRGAPGEGGWARHPLAYLVEAADDLCYHVMDFEDGTILGLIDEATARTQLAALIGNPELGGSRRSIASLRAIAINVVVKQIAEAFCAHEQALLAGEALGPLTAKIPARAALEAIRELSVERCYRAQQVLRVELAGYEVLGGLLDFLVPAVLAAPGARSKRQRKLLELLGLRELDVLDPYPRLLRVTDFLAALTDRSAVRLFRELRGTELAGARGV
jgi:dGTPase